MDYSLRESRKHGTVSFPFETYTHNWPDGYSFPLHWHNEVEVIHIVNGKIDIRVGETVYKGEQGDIITCNSRELHAVNHVDNAATHRTYIFSMDFLSFELYDLCQSQFILPLCRGKLFIERLIRPGMPGHEALLDCLRRISAYDAARSVGYYLQIKAELLRLLAELANNNYLQTDQGGYGETAKAEKLRQIFQYMGQHSHEKLQLADIAEQFGFTPKYFSRYFRLNAGLTFIEYLNLIRLERASELLLQTDEKVLTVANSVGFENLSYFIRCFKEHYQYTPAEYRKNRDSVKPREYLGHLSITSFEDAV